MVDEKGFSESVREFSEMSQHGKAVERQASAGARNGVKGNGAISLRALRCMR